MSTLIPIYRHARTVTLGKLSQTGFMTVALSSVFRSRSAAFRPGYRKRCRSQGQMMYLGWPRRVRALPVATVRTRAEVHWCRHWSPPNPAARVMVAIKDRYPGTRSDPLNDSRRSGRRVMARWFNLMTSGRIRNNTRSTTTTPYAPPLSTDSPTIPSVDSVVIPPTYAPSSVPLVPTTAPTAAATVQAAPAVARAAAAPTMAKTAARAAATVPTRSERNLRAASALTVFPVEKRNPRMASNT